MASSMEHSPSMILEMDLARSPHPQTFEPQQAACISVVRSQNQLRLDTLPIEILQNVITHGPCENALTLHFVNKHFKRVCEDPLIFQRIIANHSGRGRSPWSGIPLAIDDHWSSWARYALADSRAFSKSGMGSQGSITVVPQLRALNRQYTVLPLLAGD